jgi:hypothetical protein
MNKRYIARKSSFDPNRTLEIVYSICEFKEYSLDVRYIAVYIGGEFPINIINDMTNGFRIIDAMKEYCVNNGIALYSLRHGKVLEDFLNKK